MADRQRDNPPSLSASQSKVSFAWCLTQAKGAPHGRVRCPKRGLGRLRELRPDGRSNRQRRRGLESGRRSARRTRPPSLRIVEQWDTPPTDLQITSQEVQRAASSLVDA